MELKFRPLNADEIEVRVCTVNKGGVGLLLYKDARSDQNILDETVGPMNWQRKHTRDNANCIVSIYDEDKKQWVEKEDTGVESYESKEKGLASDSFKRSCFNWGIGRELYTAPNMFVPSDKLKAYNAETLKCYDTFKVADITYKTGLSGRLEIDTVTINICQYGKCHHTVTFSNSSEAVQKTSDGSQPKAAPVQKTQPAASPVQQQAAAKAASASVSEKQTPNNGVLFQDDEVMLIGNCRGKKYGEVKNTEVFRKFLVWVKNSHSTYDNPDQTNQFGRLKLLAAKM